MKVRLYKALIRHVLLYAAETWPVKISNLDRLKSFENRCIRKITGNWFASSGQLLSQHGFKRDIGMEVIYMKWKYLGHVLRMSAERLPRIIFLYKPPAYWKRPPGGVRLTNERYFKKACEKLIMRPSNLSRKNFELNWKSHLRNLAADRAQWKKICYDMANTQLWMRGKKKKKKKSITFLQKEPFQKGISFS